MNQIKWIASGIALCLAITAGADVWYVDKDNASGVEDGTSWATAFTTIQPAIDAATEYEDEVWLAEGDYDEARTSMLHDPPVDTHSLVLKAGVGVYGGFVGSELTRAERAAGMYSKINGRHPTSAYSGDYARHAVYAADDAVLDSVIVRGGRATAGGAALEAKSGGGIFSEATGFTIHNCWIGVNQAYEGAGMADVGEGLTVTNTTFAVNHSLGRHGCHWQSWGSSGGGAYCGFTPSEPSFFQCRFTRNTRCVSAHSSSVEARNGCSPAFSECVFENEDPVGVSVSVSGGHVVFGDCRFEACGGCVDVHTGTAAFDKCTFRNNSTVHWVYYMTRFEGANVVEIEGEVTFTDCLFQGNGGPRTLVRAVGSATFGRCTFEDNRSKCVHVYPGDSSWTDCVFRNNKDTGSVLGVYSSAARLENCVFEGNVTKSYATVVMKTEDGVFENSIFVGNKSEQGASVLQSNGGRIQMINCTLYDNTTAPKGAFCLDETSSLEVVNSILWKNAEPLFVIDTGGTVTVAHSDVEGGYAGARNIDAEPMFVSPAYGAALDLRCGSPCIDTAEAGYAPEEDFLGTPRPQGDGPDMGAFEHFLDDGDCDGMEDGWEAAHGLDPEDGTDGDDDDDEDALTNYEEYLANTDPQDDTDPAETVYVTESGSDLEGDGTAASPWRTIAHAMAQVEPYARLRRAIIDLAPGTFEEPVLFSPNVTLRGAGAGLTTLQYHVEGYEYVPISGAEYHVADENVLVSGAEGAVLEACTLKEHLDATEDTLLLLVEYVSMDVNNVRFEGHHTDGGEAARIVGVDSSDSVISGCIFQGLNNGVHTIDSGVNLTRNFFDDIGSVIRVGYGPWWSPTMMLTPCLGDAERPATTGFNTFADVSGRCVKNTSELHQMKAENNDWGVYTDEAIDAKVSGDVDFIPYIGMDTDGDGMDNIWEIVHGLDPNDAADASDDEDEDGLTNWAEYQFLTDPLDPNDPLPARYVDVAGNDETGDGSALNPWRTIERAMAAAEQYTAYRQETILVGTGTYDEPVAFVPNVRLQGAGAGETIIRHFNAEDDEHVVVTGAQGAVLEDCTLTLPGFATAITLLLRIEDAAMEVRNVLFDGNDNLFSIGLMVTGVDSSDGVVTDCTFRRLQYGIQAVNSGVNLTRNTFEDIRGDAVFVRLPEETKAKSSIVTPCLGDAKRVVTTGYNTFRNVTGKCILNASTEQTKAENNDWGVYTDEAIAAKVSGDVDYIPYIGMTEPQCPYCCHGGGVGARSGDALLWAGIAGMLFAGGILRTNRVQRRVSWP